MLSTETVQQFPGLETLLTELLRRIIQIYRRLPVVYKSHHHRHHHLNPSAEGARVQSPGVIITCVTAFGLSGHDSATSAMPHFRA